MRRVSSGRPSRSRSGSIPSVCVLLLSPLAGELDERRRGEAHVLDADPLALAVRVVAAADRCLLRLETDAPDRLLEVREDLGIPLERGTRVAVLDAVLDLDRAARLGGADVVREAGQKGDVLGEKIVVEVAHDEAQ